MSERIDSLPEPERYELREPPAYRFGLDRREFLASLGGGILVLSLAGASDALQETGRGRSRRGSGGDPGNPQEISAWLHIGQDGKVTVYTGKVEMGQNIRTSLSQVVAEELRVPVASIEMVMGDTDLTPYDSGTYGSLTTPTMAPKLRRAAAAAREMLLDLAAERWKTDRSRLRAADGRVADPDGRRSLTYGRLTQGQKLVKTIEGDPPTTPATEWKVAGQSLPKVSARALVTGAHRYASDLRRPGMLHGKVLRPPSFGATLAAVDTAAAEAMPGVVVVRDGDFVGVAAPTPQAAARALEALRAEWKPVPQPSGPELFDLLKRTSDRSNTVHAQGSLEDGLAAADRKLSRTYTVSYIAHVPLEPRAAVAEWVDGKVTVWTGTQRPFGVREELMGAFRLPQERVRVIMPDTGSGYGGKHSGECAVEAARLAKAAGKPVKLTWTREEEFTWAYFRPAGVIEVTSGVRADGTLTAWDFHNYNSGAAGIRTFYEIPHQRIEFHPSRSPLRQGSYRALAATANHFARETHMDEVAASVGLDPLEFRLRNLKDERLIAVFRAAADRFGWGKALPKGHGAGIAGGFEKGGYTATCAEVTVDPASGEVRVPRIVTAFECGAILNPDHLKHQVEGLALMGLGGALFEAIDFADGRILNPRLSLYRVPRFSDLPQVEVVLLDRKDLPSAGGGETPICGVAPAIGGALFQVTGQRLRSLPLARKGSINTTDTH